MLDRKLEPEVMNTAAEAVDYDAMDHSEVNRAFVDDFLNFARQTPLRRYLGNSAEPLRVLDCGTGTAQIPLELCRRDAACHVVAIDLAAEMLRVAERNVAAANLAHRIDLQHMDAKTLPFADGSFAAVMSNSIVHHIPEPSRVLREMSRIVREGGVLFVRDLLRPGDRLEVERLVETYADEANPHQRQMFYDSLLAALTMEEVRELLASLQLPQDWVSQTTDRHWTIRGFISSGAIS